MKQVMEQVKEPFSHKAQKQARVADSVTNEAWRETELEDYIALIKHNLFAKQVDKTALIFAGQHVSYAEMAESVLRIMTAFEKDGLSSGMVAAVCLRKSPEFIFTVLACTLTGVIWLPIDMDSPAERMHYLLENSRVDRVISQTPIEGKANLDIASLMQIPKMATEDSICYSLDETPAYYLYTSGSTGTPKCVVLNHRATANVIQETVQCWNITDKDCVMAVTPFHHDMSVFDIFATLSVGATLVLPSQEQQKDARAWAELVARHNISIWVSVPAIVDMLFTLSEPEQLSSLRLIAQGGDYIKPTLIERIRGLLPNTRLFSLGGPTETTIWSIWHEIQDHDLDAIPYGKALAFNQYYILNDQLQPCEVGEVGKMYMSGINLSNGYLLDGQLIKNDFLQIRNTQQCLETVFQMSDLGYEREDGSIIFAGREEGYLKVKGVRISAIEVENALSKHSQVKDAIVLSCSHPEDDLTELLALYTKDDAVSEMVSKVELREYLKRSLPLSHIPTKWLSIERLPLTVNGKVDRKTLAKFAQEHFFPLSTSALCAASDIRDSVLNVFKEAVEVSESVSISEQTLLSELNLRPKQLMKISKQLADIFSLPVDFYKIAKCRTLKDVVAYLEKQSCVA
ncbi:AMP-binding protein [Marinomonas mediterranea]|jgi:Non-ribosomal peptide synthetase modules and related proteins|uniref:Phenylalanine racemase (ATP-hydrolyzing) n=1 Tax=Marinomonas mediterranea (strain ATCC 700492 / JCM 21426 / NBRC 103028 / MMB-1) TaxID=717774 RepID=F2JYD9_MARM1|nr:AMP-binding protein [Marinomonas mediterranea]ADZ91970.1 Phenylalanine racemase (ATP-hydrolyzing) [Marinomonas mediterranea MMB-1]